MTKTARQTGTREWSTASANCGLGCPHGCLYCYARHQALRWKRILRAEDWTTWVPGSPTRLAKRRVPGVVMFPTAHDITPENLEFCLYTLKKLLAAGNSVLLVTKPHRDCIEAICRARVVADARDRLEIRATIGALSEEILAFWEPGAPTFLERTQALALARDLGYATSVSCEPLLEPERVYDLVHRITPLLTANGTIWIGALNKIAARTAWAAAPGSGVDTLRLAYEVGRLQYYQTPEQIREIYDLLRDNPRIRWKDSYREALGLAPTFLEGPGT